MCVGEIGEVIPPLTLSSHLRYVGVVLGGDGNCSQSKYQKLASKKAWQPKLVVFYTKVLSMNPSHYRNWYCVPKTLIRFHILWNYFIFELLVSVETFLKKVS
jgi:hypothetical protein